MNDFDATQEYRHENTGMRYRITPSGEVQYHNGGYWMASLCTAEQILNDPKSFIPIKQETNQQKNAWYDRMEETVTVEVPKQNALVAHIEELQRVITRRNKRIEELEAEVDTLQREVKKQEEETPVETPKPGFYRMKGTDITPEWFRNGKGEWFHKDGCRVRDDHDYETRQIHYIERV